MTLIYIINSTGPIIIFILNFIIYGKAISYQDILGSIVCILGIIMVVEPAFYYHLLGLNFTDNRIQQIRFVYFEGTEKLLVLLGVVIIKILWSYGFIVM
jgi:drug/metabolite transporter (DMT)-like permease